MAVFLALPFQDSLVHGIMNHDSWNAQAIRSDFDEIVMDDSHAMPCQFTVLHRPSSPDAYFQREHDQVLKSQVTQDCPKPHLISFFV